MRRLRLRVGVTLAGVWLLDQARSSLHSLSCDLLKQYLLVGRAVGLGGSLPYL